MNLIAAVDQNWAIGKGNSLLVRIPADQKRFRDMTMGKVVVMGRKTLESLPGGLPLKGRTNIVLTRNKDYRIFATGAGEEPIYAHSAEEAMRLLEPYPDGDVFIIGGESVYREFLGACDTAYITKISYAYDADAYFPNLDMMPEWEAKREGEEQTYFNLEYYFYRYERRGGRAIEP